MSCEAGRGSITFPVKSQESFSDVLKTFQESKINHNGNLCSLVCRAVRGLKGLVSLCGVVGEMDTPGKLRCLLHHHNGQDASPGARIYSGALHGPSTLTRVRQGWHVLGFCSETPITVLFFSGKNPC